MPKGKTSDPQEELYKKFNNKSLPSRKELNKVQKWADEKMRKREKEQRKVFEKEELKRNNTKNLILIKGLDGSELGNLTINILDPISILIGFIIRELKVYNITSIVINNISLNFDREFYHFRHRFFSCSSSIKRYFNLSEDTDNILVQIIYGSYLNYIEFIISDCVCVVDLFHEDPDDDEIDYYASGYDIDYYPADPDDNEILNMMRNRAKKRIENIPKNYLSSNLDEFNQIIANYNGLLQYMWVINYLQSYFE